MSTSVGIDFDNTIVCYDRTFHNEALKMGLIPKEIAARKNSVRDYLRGIGGEDEWIKLQGLVYGDRISSAPPFDGVVEFLRQCQENDVTIQIISHRTKHAARGYPYDLHKAAHNWLDAHGFKDRINLGRQVQGIHFELTKREKLQRVAKSGCEYFIDDLPEFLLDPSFPDSVKSLLFDPEGTAEVRAPVQKVLSWSEISSTIFDSK